MNLQKVACHLWSQLENSNVSREMVIGCLRALGQSNTTTNPHQSLALASRLEPQFSALKVALPALKDVLDGFLLAPKLVHLDFSSIDAEPDNRDISDKAKINKSSSIKFPIDIESYWKREPDQFERPQVASACALLWLSLAVANYVAHNSISQQSERTLKADDIKVIVLTIAYRDCSLPGSVAPKREISDVGFAAWACQLPIESEDEEDDNPPQHDLIKLKAVAQTLVDLNSALLIASAPTALNAADAAKAEMNESVDQSTDLTFARDFSVRSLLKSHWNFPRPSEFKALVNLLGVLKSPDRPLIAPSQFYESILIALALLCGQTIKEVLNLSVNTQPQPQGKRYATDFLQVQEFDTVGRKGASKQQWILRNIKGFGQNDRVRLALPEALSKGILHYIHLSAAARLEHLLPLSDVPWEDRCYRLLQQQLSTPRKRAELLVRDFLSRQLFAATTNAALVRLLCDQTITGEKHSGRRQIALSYYLNLRPSQVWEVYKEVCEELLPFGLQPPTLKDALSERQDVPDYVLSLTQFRSLTGYMSSRIVPIDEAQNLIDVHNAFADYTLLLLVAATGHRKSLTPLYFPWDICLEEKLAFISDKQVTGSEARFVPLPQVAVDQYQAYRSHLLALLPKLADFSAVARHVQSLLSSELGHTGERANITHCADPEYSQFFFIDAERQPQTLGTNRLDQIINAARIPGALEQISVRRFRNGLADYLWGALKSGSKVQAWLGHASELHSFGEASTWSVQEWANEIRPLVQAYLSERGLVCRASPLVRGARPTMGGAHGAPSLSMGTASYEGRAVSSKFASTRALKVLRQMLPEDYLEWQASPSLDGDNSAAQFLVIDDVLEKQMAQELRYRLGGDRLALDKVTNTINQEFRRLRKLGARVTAASINLFRSDPGPVSVNFSRHLRIASEIRRAWLARWLDDGLGRLEDLNQASIARLAHLAISLVIFDATLDPIRVKALTLAATSPDNLQIHPDTITLRAPIATARDIYDWLILPSPITAMQLIGLRRASVSPVPENEENEAVETGSFAPINKADLWKQIDKEICSLLRRMQERKSALTVSNLSELCLVFRPWWHLRLPGALYALAAGAYAGPAPSRTSEQSLFGANELQPLSARPREVRARLPTNEAKKQVNRLINALFSPGEALLSRAGRANLRRMMTQPFCEELLFYINEQAIVQHALGFIEYLLDVGGPHEPNLRFSSIRTYYSKVMPLLIDRWWDKSIVDWSGADFDKAYSELLRPSASLQATNLAGNQGDALSALKQFHRYLKDTTDAPFSSFLLQQKPQPARRRSDVLTWRAIECAVRDVRNDKSISDMGRLQAGTMITMGAGYGIRRNEVTALSTDSFFGKSDPPLGVVINRSRFADIKSSAGRRVIAKPLLSSALKKIASTAFKMAKGAEKPGVDTSRNARLIDIGEADAYWSYDLLGQCCISALRRASASNATVLHSLRHTFATALMLELFRQRSPLVQPNSDEQASNGSSSFTHLACLTTRERLLGELDGKSELVEMLQLPQNWPFAVDSVAQVLGHVDVSTLLGCYFHGAPILLAEHTHGYSRDTDLIDERLALLLALERSTVTKRRKSFSSSKGGSNGRKNATTPIEQVLSFDLMKGAKPVKPLVEHQKNTPPPELQSLPWVLLDDLLVSRSVGEHSLDFMKEQALQRNFSGAKANQFIASYKNLVEATGFDDFEFKGSELVDHAPKRSGGVSRSKEERQDCLRLLQSKSLNNPVLCDKLSIIAKIWSERTDPGDPWLVLKDESEALALEGLCNALEINWRSSGNGIPRPRDVEVYLTGAPASGLIQYLQSAGIATSQNPKRVRFSRAGGGVKVSEVGVRFLQRVKSRIGDGRDAHRLFFVLAVALSLGT